MKNECRDFVMFLWGGVLASGIWAAVVFDGVPVGPFLYVFVPIAIIFTLIYFIKPLLQNAFKKD
jgi:hypothetical protein